LRVYNKEGESMFSFKNLLVVNKNAAIITDGSLANPAAGQNNDQP